MHPPTENENDGTKDSFMRGRLSQWIKQPEYEVDHSPPSSAEVKNVWSYTSTPQVFMVWHLAKHRMFS
jgi:hypothetical protein